MLKGSDVVMSAWCSNQLVGFGRATSDGVFRAVLWDVVVHRAMHGKGLGTQLVKGLLTDPKVANAERVYLMTTEGVKFYEKLGFERCSTQHLMRLDHDNHKN